MFSRWLTLLRGLVGSQKIGDRPVPFGPSEETVLDAALKLLTGHTDGNTVLTETTIPQLWHLLDSPPDRPGRGRAATPRVRHFLDETRLLRDALGQLVGGSLRGLFDDHTTIALDWTAPIQSLSLSRLEAARRRGGRDGADVPQQLGPGDAGDRRPRRHADRRSATSPGSSCGSGSRR